MGIQLNTLKFYGARPCRQKDRGGVFLQWSLPTMVMMN
jgi:hypothetical protein